MEPGCEHWVAIDLDQTFLFQDLPESGETTVVTMRGGKPSSRIPNDSLLLLQALAEKFTIVPITSRSGESFRRVSLDGVPFELAGVHHGAELLVGDESDSARREHLHSKMAKWEERLTGIQSKLEAGVCRNAETRLVRVEGVGACYFRAKFRDAGDAEVAHSEIAEDWDMELCEVTLVGTQVHVTPAPVTKGALVSYLSRTYFDERPPTLAFGDSGADFGMLARSRFGAIPVGSSLWKRVHG